jgi:hypothetical protein
MIEIPLTKGKVALIDDEDSARVMAHKWTAMFVPKSNKWYARRNTVRRENGRKCQQSILLHRFIIDAPPHLQVDHINNDGLDNRRSNLRFASNAQNHANMKMSTKNKSGFKGVCWLKERRRWLASITVNQTTHYLGHFKDPLDAARAYDAKARELCGEFARLNFPQEVQA